MKNSVNNNMREKLLKILGVIMIASGGFIIGLSLPNLFVFDKHDSMYWYLKIATGVLVIIAGLLNLSISQKPKTTP